MLATGVQSSSSLDCEPAPAPVPVPVSIPAPVPVPVPSPSPEPLPVPGCTSDCNSLGRNLQHKFPAAIRLHQQRECVCVCVLRLLPATATCLPVSTPPPPPTSLCPFACHVVVGLKFSALPCLISFRMIIVCLPLAAAASYNVFPLLVVLLARVAPALYYGHICPLAPLPPFPLNWNWLELVVLFWAHHFASFACSQHTYPLICLYLCVCGGYC